MDTIKAVGVLHVIWNILSWWVAWTVAAMVFLILKKDMTLEEKQVCYDIINFNLSFYIYFAIWMLLCVILIWFVILPILFVIWLYNLISWGITHYRWERYEYPFIIKFFN
jgi:hypothetical protein